ncbi:MAG: hypothetical protein ABR571_17140 [Jatrophihabitans sp.]|uniref:hypothetical protein n=1 Tax=Jatrophihabitans sp. TaxID=1932789 RepID=UPI0039121617
MSDINDTTPDEDVEGHGSRPRANDSDDDVEGHGITRPQAGSRPRAADDDDDVEGHSSRPR